MSSNASSASTSGQIWIGLGFAAIAASIVFVGVQLRDLGRAQLALAQSLEQVAGARAPAFAPPLPMGTMPGMPTAGAGAPEANAFDLSKLQPLGAEDRVIGDRNAEVTLISFMDLECPFCAKFLPAAKAFAEQHKGKVNFAFRHFPLASHSQAEVLALAAECAGEQGGDAAFWTVIESVYAKGRIPSVPDFVREAAQSARVDGGKLQACIDSGRHLDRIRRSLAQAEAIGMRGTPASVMRNVKTGESTVIMGLKDLSQELAKLSD